MTSLRIAAAQSTSVAGDIATNVLIHTRFITAAHQAGVDLLVFPELSLSGYELPRLSDCLVQPDDLCLAPIRELVRQTRITVVVGAPLLHGNKPAPSIAAITFFPDGTSSVYCKQHLHPGEAQYVAPGDTGCQRHEVRDTSYALAICADTSHPSHAHAAAATGAALYLAGVLVSEAGYAADSAQLAQYAQQFNIGVLMVNHGGPSGGYLAAGQSAFWAPGGQPVVAVPGTGNALLIAENDAGHWRGEVHTVTT
ncbi:carbon-nitrogen hydrolase family protein [Rhodoferax antarcticus]|uniref:carbon-nitrogen hydrolase family protein n=1 Tax=Rhodoferax antarcticus TaxID=81479 RepID=UPI002224DF48|nr:carbon-nitrogen hydrolase family protein [Rhodoferax antarcticus]MCW2314295.1 putative amidohydrolase [Rhodoferax antarcticus]